MKFSFLELVKEKVQVHQQESAVNDQKRASALAEIEAAKAEENALIDRQIEGQDVIDELAKAQARIKVAETKYKRMVAEIGSTNAPLDLKGISYGSIDSQFMYYTHNDLEEDMKEELEALRVAKEQYLVTAEKALVKFYELRKELREQVKEAEQLFGKPVTGNLPPGMNESLLRPHGLWWDRNDAHNEIYPVKQRANEAVEGRPYIPPIKIEPNVRILRDNKPDEWVDPMNPSITYKRAKKEN